MTQCNMGKIHKKQGAFLGKHLVFLSKREVLTNQTSDVLTKKDQ